MITSRTPRIISWVLVVLLFASSTEAQIGDWQAVENLKSGTRILVKATERYFCSFEGASNDQLVCEVPKHGSLGRATVAILRSEITEVRRLPNQAKAAWIGAGVGAGAGAVLGASTSKNVARGQCIFRRRRRGGLGRSSWRDSSDLSGSVSPRQGHLQAIGLRIKALTSGGTR